MSDDDIKIISALNLDINRMKIRTKTSEVIKAKDVIYDPTKKQIIGGDTTDFTHDRHPAIIIEKDGDKMSKILVRCPCGRHSELVCEYDNEPEEKENKVTETVTSEVLEETNNKQVES